MRGFERPGELRIHYSSQQGAGIVRVAVARGPLNAKYVEFRDGDRLRSAAIYVVLGLRRDGRKQVLACLPRAGRENLEDWKLVLRSLIERGLRRVLILVHDDFSGLLPITQSLFPNSDVQLCTVHLQRNAKTHLSKSDAPSSNNAGAPLKLPGTWRSRNSSSNSSVIVSPKAIPASSSRSARSDRTTCPSSPIPMPSVAPSAPPTLSRPSMDNWKSSAATAAAISNPKKV